ncbi:LPS export ABC transporter permease LptF [Thiomonas sp.]|jgi:lipopolysaccharide export system permease protein|uniref:LPS export ABC transporter permease LptF n=1 Tax=Thiomonas sp. TaxID=2047785 RepID=UPI00263A0BFD|nr:LPS export ABC transporter permease LptF [Thiomonas sp.]
MLLDLTLRREMSRNFGGAFTVLFTVVITLMLIRILGQASDGQASPQDVFVLIGLTALSYLQIVITLALFLAVLLTFTRMWLDAEMIIWRTTGVGWAQLLASVLRFSWPILLLIAALTLVAWPWANQQSTALRIRFEQRSDLSRVAPGQFRESASGKRVFFIDKGAQAGGVAHDVFIRDDTSGQTVLITARSAQVQRIDGQPFLVLRNGNRYAHTPGALNYTITAFDSLDMRLDATSGLSSMSPGKTGPVNWLTQPNRNVPTAYLFNPAVPNWLGELSWRLGVPLSAALLALLAAPLASGAVRTGRAGSLIAAILVYLIYFNLLNVLQGWISQGRVGFTTGFVLLHGSAALLLLALLWRGNGGPQRLWHSLWHRGAPA